MIKSLKNNQINSTNQVYNKNEFLLMNNVFEIHRYHKKIILFCMIFLKIQEKMD